MRREILIGSLFFLALLALVSQPGMAQLTSGNVIGTVLDATGAAVPNATVMATDRATGVNSNAVTGTSGQYRFDNLRVGTYDVTVTAQGFTTTTLSKLLVEANKTATANVTLTVGQLSTTVEVTEAASTIDTTTAQIQTTFDSTVSADMAITSTAGVGVLNLSLLGAGVANMGGTGEGEGPSVGGQRPRNNNFMIEGVDNNEKSTTGSLIYVPNDAVGEFTMLQNQFSAEFGHSSGGQFNTIVKSGTNSLHGDIYDYLQNRNLNAVDQSAANSGFRTNPRYDQNRLGATIGGPIIKNKLFYFGSFEYNPTGEASPPASAILTPTTAGYAQIAALPGISQTNLSILEKYLPATSTATSTINMYPPNAPSGTTVPIPVGVYNLAAPNYENAYYAVGSVDYNISEKDQLRGRFIYNKTSQIDTSSVLPQFFASEPVTYWLPTISEYHTFTPTLTNELRIGYNRFNQQVPAPDVKYPGLDQFPSFIFYDLSAPLGPDTGAPQFTIQNTYQLTENLSWIHGAHTFKFGFDGRKYISPQTFTQRSRGDYEYTYVSEFLYDQTPDYIAQRSLGNPVYYGDEIATYLYGQDSWKVNQHLTLDLGLRWEFTGVPHSEGDQTLNNYASVPGVLEFTKPKPQYHNFAPRVGIAYSPGTSGRTAIRAGFGMNYDVLYDNIGILALPPQLSTTVDVTAANPFTGSNFLANGGIKPNAATGPQLSVADARAATASYLPNQEVPYSIQWNFGVQHVFAQNYTFEARYLGTRGIHLDVQQRIMNGSPLTPQNALPLFMSTPTAAQLSAIPNTLQDLDNISLSGNPNAPNFILPRFANAGFTNAALVEDSPIGNSSYNGLALQLNRRFTSGFQMIGAYTWSHNIDDATDDFFSTYLTPRRAQDFQNLRPDRASSALDRRQRLTLTALYDVPFFKGSNSWLMKNLVGNWQMSGIYTYESPEYATVQSGLDANLNGDTAGDRVWVNPNGIGNTGSDVFGIDRNGSETSDASKIVAYMPVDPNAKYIRAGAGQLPNGGRNTLPLRPTDNVDFALLKRFSITERAKLQFQGQFANLFNHPQYTGGYLDNVNGGNQTIVNTILIAGGTHNLLIPGNSSFNRPDLTFLSNARTITVVAKIVF